MAQQRWSREAMAVCAVLLAAACTSPADASSAPTADPTWPAPPLGAEPAWPARVAAWPTVDVPVPVPVVRDWPTGVARELEPTGLLLAGGAGIEGLAVDGAGMLWVDGPWQVARVDPTTGEARVWDAADDAAFGTVQQVVPSSTSGVWLVEPTHLRLFDGVRIAVDLPVPREYRGTTGAVAMVEREAEAWIGTDTGIARWSEGQWSAIGLGQVSDVVAMAVDGAGDVWASGRIVTPVGRRRGVARFDGRSWVVPGGGPMAPSGHVTEIDADPTGGVVVRSGSFRPLVHRFDGRRWSGLTPGLSGSPIGELGRDGIAVAPDGRVWVAGGIGVAASDPRGTWQVLVPPGRLARPPSQRAPIALAFTRGSLFATDEYGILRQEGDGFARLWRDPALPRGDIADDGRPGTGLVAASAHEAWVDLRPPGIWLPRVVRYADGAWSTSDPPRTAFGDEGLAGVPVLATDGAIWQVTAEGLARFHGDAWAIVDPDLVGAGLREDGAAAGPGGSLWLLPPDPAAPLVEIGPSGRQRDIALPGALRGSSVVSVAPARGGGAWVILRGVGAAWWSGSRWAGVIPLPSGYERAAEAVIGGDGALWASLRPLDRGAGWAVARLDANRWRTFDLQVHGVQRSVGGVCGVRGPRPVSGSVARPADATEVVCLDRAGRHQVTRMPVPGRTAAVARDGAVWVLGEQLARLPDPVGTEGAGNRPPEPSRRSGRRIPSQESAISTISAHRLRTAATDFAADALAKRWLRDL